MSGLVSRPADGVGNGIEKQAGWLASWQLCKKKYLIKSLVAISTRTETYPHCASGSEVSVTL